MMPLTHFLVAYLLTEPMVGRWALAFGSLAVVIDLDHVATYYLKFGKFDPGETWRYSSANYDWDLVGPLHSKWLFVGLPLLLISDPFLQAFLLAYYSHLLLDRLNYCCSRVGFLDRKLGPSWYPLAENEMIFMLGLLAYLTVR